MSIFKKSKKAIFDKTIAIKVLEKMLHDLEQENIQAWLTDGTLLGYYREKDFIGHDMDMDLGVFIDDYKPDLLVHLEDKGWKLVRKLGFRDLGLELTLSRDQHKIDLFFFYKEGDKLWHAAWQGFKKDGKRYRRMIKYYYDSFSLSQSIFQGIRVSVPENPEKYIITKYGENWRIPVKNWDWALDPSNSRLTDIEIPYNTKG